MTLELPDLVIDTLIDALNDGILIQKQAGLCDLAALDFIPTAILPHLKLHHQKAIALSFSIAKNNFLGHAIEQHSTINNNEYDSNNHKRDRNAGIDIKELYKLSKHEDWRIRAKVAANKNTPVDILERLANDSYQQYCLTTRSKSYIKFPIQISVAKNHSTPGYVLENLFKTRELFICTEIAKNPQTPIDLLQRMKVEENYIVHKYIYSKQKIQIKYLKEDFCIQSFIGTIHSNLAKNYNLPLDIIEIFAKHRDFYVRINIIDNINTPLYVLQKMYISSTEKYEKKRILSRIDSIYKKIAGNSETSSEQLQEILKHQNLEIRLTVTQHPQGLSLLLDRCLKPERCLPKQNSLNRVLAGMHPAISQQQIDGLFNSDNWLDRLSVACNSKCSEEYLLQLTQNEKDFVKQVARELLKRKD